jgi:hypothetical protein
LSGISESTFRLKDNDSPVNEPVDSIKIIIKDTPSLFNKNLFIGLKHPAPGILTA